MLSQTATYQVKGTIQIDESSIEAKKNKKLDFNDNPCALVIISKGGVHGLKFDLKGFSPCGVEERETEYYLWIPANTRVIYLKHPDRGNLEVTIPTIIKQGKTYRMYLLSNVVKETTYKQVKPEEINFYIDPPNAKIAIYRAGENGDVVLRERQIKNGQFGKLLRPGQYRIVLKARRYDDFEAEFTIVPNGDSTYNYSLVPNFAEVTFNTRPESGATIYIDGRQEASTTPATIKIDPGMRNIQLELEDFATVEIDTLIEKQREYVFDIPMRSTVSKSSIVTDDVADIYLDGNKIATGGYFGKLVDGEHHITIKRSKYYDFDTTVVIQAGVPFNLDKELKPIQGTLMVESLPNKADVYIDGRLMGKTPLFLPIMIGSHNVEVKSTGFAPDYQSVTITENQEVNIFSELSESRDIVINSDPAGSSVYMDEGNGYTYKGSTPFTFSPMGSSENLKIRLEQDGYNTYYTQQVFRAGQAYTFQMEKVTVTQKVNKIIAANDYVDFFDGRTDMEFNYYVTDNYGFEMRSTRYNRYFHFALPLTNVAYRSIPIETTTFDSSTLLTETKSQPLNTLTTMGMLGFNYGFGTSDFLVSFDLDAYLYGGVYFTGGDMTTVEPLTQGTTHYGYGLDGSVRVNFGNFYVRAKTTLYGYDNLLQEQLFFTNEGNLTAATDPLQDLSLSAFTLGLGFNLTDSYDNSMYETFGSNGSYSGYWGFVFGMNSYEGTRLGMFFKSYFGGGWYGSMNFNYDYSSIPAYSFNESGSASDPVGSASTYNAAIAERKANGIAANSTIDYSTLSLIDYELGYSFGFYESGFSSLMLELNMYAGFGFSFLEDGVGELDSGEDLYGLGFKYFLGFRPRIVYSVDEVITIYAESTIYEYDNHLSSQLYYMTDNGTNSRTTYVTDPDITFVPFITVGMGFPF
ncbi:MAG: hypothetical protein SchgKO_03360 [Schleiferiaceae bacterium]